MENNLKMLKRNTLKEGGFAGLKEHRLVKSPELSGSQENSDGSWPGIANFVYLADARFMPQGETHMHPHHEIDVITVMVDGRISHEGSMAHGKELSANDVQAQRAGGEGFSHNEINPDASWNRLLQLWVLPEISGQAADYKLIQPVQGEMTRIYGGRDNDAVYTSKTMIDMALLNKGQKIELIKPFLAYISRGKGRANDKDIEDGDLIRGNSLHFEASEDVQLIIIYSV